MVDKTSVEQSSSGDLNAVWQSRRVRLGMVFAASLTVSILTAVLASVNTGIGVLGYAAMLLVLVAGIALVVFAVVGIARHRNRPPALAVSHGGFVPVPVAATIAYAACAGLAWAFPAVQIVSLYDAVTTGDRAGDLGALLTAEVVSTLLLTAIAVVVARMTYRVYRGLTRIRLRPEGVEVPTTSGTSHLIRWSALRAGTPVRPAETTRRIRLELDPPMRARAGLVFRHLELDLAPLDVHPWFFVDVVRYYVDHPGRRGAIGTQAEYDRMRAEVFALATG